MDEDEEQIPNGQERPDDADAQQPPSSSSSRENIDAVNVQEELAILEAIRAEAAAEDDLERLRQIMATESSDSSDGFEL